MRNEGGLLLQYKKKESLYQLRQTNLRWSYKTMNVNKAIRVAIWELGWLILFTSIIKSFQNILVYLLGIVNHRKKLNLLEIIFLLLFIIYMYTQFRIKKKKFHFFVF